MVKTRRSVTALVLVVSLAVLLVLSYGTPVGRRVVRQALRTARLVRTATGVYPPPVLILRMWRATEPLVRVELHQSGLLEVSGAQRVERHLTPETVKRLLDIGGKALGDFSSRGCGISTAGVSADLYLLRDGSWWGSVCRDSMDWPRGMETRQLLTEIEAELPAGMKLLVTH